MLAALDEIAAAHDVEPAAVALAWLARPADGPRPDRQRPQRSTSSPPSSPPSQLDLSDDELARLTAI